ncbi:MAG: TRAP transporter fused permease subunit [Sphaerochaetaceae bacterium]|nr:TRAP transporter fused permease subunit [Sphaerochaetaceae bacterium]
MKTEGLYQKFVRYVILLVSLYTIAFHIGQFTFARMPSIKFYALHVMVAIVLIFLYYPLDRKRPEASKAVHTICHIVDWAIIILGVVASLYVILNFDAYVDDMQNSVMTNKMIYFFGIVLVLIILESARRTLGLALPIIALVAIGYALIAHRIPGLFGNRQLTFKRIIFALFSDRGIYGTPTATCANNVFLFLMFAAFLNASGADKIFQDFAIAITGRKRGGPAKMAVVGSALFGTISGSCVANVVSTGSFTIPLMKRNGYRSAVAGAVESVASTGGQIMPPIMGAAAFLMSEYMGEPYMRVALWAILPAALYFSGIFISVHLEAKKLGLKGTSRDKLPKLRILARQLYLLLPLVILVWLVSANIRSLAYSATLAIAIAILVAIPNNAKEEKNFKGTVKKSLAMTYESLSAGGRSCITVIVACSMAGMVAGCITVTGLASRLISTIVSISQSIPNPALGLFIALFLTMVSCIILGMGVPTTANYCIMASTTAPILITLGIPRVAAHFFVFYFGIVADITPPVALAAYAGSAIAKSDPMKTAINATKLAIAAFIVPYVFCFNPSMLLMDQGALKAIQGIITSMVGLFGVSMALEGFYRTKMQTWLRICSALAGLMLIFPGTVTDTLGILGVVLVIFINSKSKKAIA